jgi:hypothetical protein
MERPSGDQVGDISRTPGVWVRLRISPFWAGTVKTSPRASKTARLPVGERPKPSMLPRTFLKYGTVSGRSP